MVGQIKQIIIIVLVISAAYLTGRLWFDEISNHDFFSTLSSFVFEPEPNLEAEQNYFVRPPRIVTILGDGFFDLKYSELDSSTQKNNCDEAITAALTRGEYKGAQVVPFSDMLQYKGYFFQYTEPMPTNVFTLSYPQTKSSLTSKLKLFNYIFVQVHDDTNIIVTFYDQTTSQAYTYAIHNVFLEKQISDSINSVNQSESRLKYVYSRNFFIPQVDKDGYNYMSVKVKNQYMDQGGLLIDYIKKKVNPFFAGSGTKWEAISADNVFTYSDESTLVKYYPAALPSEMDILEYSRYQVIDRHLAQSVANDYNTAIQFISHDTAVTNEYYLADIAKNENSNTFYFNYTINDMPLLNQNLSNSQISLKYPIEIIVENGVVTKYRKIVYEFTLDVFELRTARLPFEDVVQNLLEVGESPNDLALNNISLSYKFDASDELELYWYLDINGMSYTKSAETKLTSPR